IAPFAAFATADGHMIVAAGTDALFRKLCTTIDRPELATDPRFAGNDGRARNIDALTEALETALQCRPTADWLAALETAGVPCGPINDLAAIAADPQIAARNMIVTIDDPDAQPLKLAGNPIKLSAFHDPASRPAAPALDGDREAILRELEVAPEATRP
ncbi:MAG: CoA transferase, partial [Dongiaceae bacterium]